MGGGGRGGGVVWFPSCSSSSSFTAPIIWRAAYILKYSKMCVYLICLTVIRMLIVNYKMGQVWLLGYPDVRKRKSKSRKKILLYQVQSLGGHFQGCAVHLRSNISQRDAILHYLMVLIEF